MGVVEVEEEGEVVLEVEVCVCCNSSQCFPHNKTNSPSVTDPGLLETALMNRHNSLTYLSLTQAPCYTLVTLYNTHVT